MIASMIALQIALLVTNAHAATCAECQELATIVKDYKAQASTAKPAYAKLEGRAVTVVQKMTEKSKTLSAEQLDAYFEVLRYATPVDPGAVFVEDTIDVIRANRAAIDTKIKKLPSQEASHLEDALDAYTSNAENGPD
jgi:hypothetical protein